MKKRSFIKSLALAILATFSSFVTAATERVEGGKDLPKVLIIGDSISIGYTPFVKRMLEKEATVAHNKGNAQHTGTGLKNIDDWLGDTQWKVIHFNWGLHDLCYRGPNSQKNAGRDKVNGTLTCSPEQYEKNLDLLVQRLEKTGASLIWASTTIVPEGEEGRIAGDDKKYNEIAARVMIKHGVVINDLNAATASFSPDLFLKPGNVHFKPTGYEKLGLQVSESILRALKAPVNADAVPKP